MQRQLELDLPEPRSKAESRRAVSVRRSALAPGQKQPCLPGSEPASRDSLCFALRPDDVAADAMLAVGRALRIRHRLRGKSLARDRLHLSLHGIGVFDGLPAASVARAKQAAATVKMPAFDVSVSLAMSFLGRDRRRPLVLLACGELDPLRDLHARLGKAMTQLALGRHVQRAFTPHVTIHYGDAIPQEVAIVPIRWRVRSFVLIHSAWSQGRHIPLAMWPLVDAGER